MKILLIYTLINILDSLTLLNIQVAHAGQKYVEIYVNIVNSVHKTFVEDKMFWIQAKSAIDDIKLSMMMVSKMARSDVERRLTRAKD